MEPPFSPKTHRLCLWSGAALAVLVGIGALPMARLLPPPSPDWPAETLVEWLVGHQVSFQIGCVLMLMGATLFGPWGAVLAILTRKTEGRFPVLYATQIVSLTVGTIIVVLWQVCWAVASFRAGETSPQITQALWDLGWFVFVFTPAPYLVWMGAIALEILWNPPECQLYPRWTGYVTLGVALEFVPSAGIVFFKSGPWSYTGSLAIWLAFIMYFGWVCVMTFSGLKAVARQEALSCLEEAAERGSHMSSPGMVPPNARSAAVPAPGTLDMGSS